MSFTMEFKVDGAAVDNDSQAVAELVQEVAEKIRTEWQSAGVIYDANGQLVGKWSLDKNFPEPNEDDDYWNETFDDDDGFLYPAKYHQAEDEWYPAANSRWNAQRGDYDYVN